MTARPAPRDVPVPRVNPGAVALAERDSRVVVITAAMLEGTGLKKFQTLFPERCLDVGMAEQHGVGLASGLALAGYRPICAIYSLTGFRMHKPGGKFWSITRPPFMNLDER